MNLELGQELVWDGVRFELIALDASSARLRAIDEGFVRIALVSELQHDPAVEWPGTSLRVIRTFDEKAIAALPPAQRRKVEVWLPSIARLDQYIKAARRDSAETTLLVNEIAQDVRAQLGTEVIDPRTVWRKLRAYRDFGALGFIDRRYREKTPFRRDPLLIEVVAAVCRRADIQSTGTRGRVVDDILYEIADRYGDNPPFKTPSARTLHRIIAEIPRAKHLTRSAKTRASLANKPLDEYQQHQSPRLGEHVQIDTTKFDAEIMLDDGRVTNRGGVERPEMTILLDIRSRTPLAAVLRAGGTKAVDLVTLLARALTPYERRPQGARETRQLVSAGWAAPAGIDQAELDRYRAMMPIIFPETITIDHGKIFTSRAFTEGCSRLGISIIENNPYTPTGKPHVEANFGTIGEQFAQYWRSHVGRSVEHRGKDTAPHPAPTLLQAQELLDDWIAVHWMHRPHDGLRDPLRPRRALTPMETVTMLREITPELPIPFGREEYISLLPREERTMQDYGINIGRRRYTSPRLREIASSTPRVKGGKWNLRRDPFNIYTMWLEHDGEFVPLTWTSGDAQMPFRDEVMRSLRDSDGAERELTGSAAAALRRGIRQGKYGDPVAARNDARARAAMNDPMALTSTPDALEGESADEDVRAPDPRFPRTGGNGYLEGAGDVDGPADERLWEEAGGFSMAADEVKGRLDD